MSNIDIEKLTGEIHIEDITELVHLISANKVRFSMVKFDRRGDYWVFEIQNNDSKNAKKLLGIIDSFIKKLTIHEKNYVRREKNGQITDEVTYE